MSNIDQTLERESAVALLPSSNCRAGVELYSSAGLALESTCMWARTFPLVAASWIKPFVTSPSSTVLLLLWPPCLDRKLWCVWLSHTHPTDFLQLPLPVGTQVCKSGLPAASISCRAHTSQERAYSSHKGSLASPRSWETSGKVYFGGLNNVGAVSTLFPHLCIKHGDISMPLHVMHVAFSFIKGSLYL